MDSSTRETASSVVDRKDFVGAFFRPEGSPPFGIFTASSSQIAPAPYPVPGGALTGSSGYCEKIAANGHSINGSYVVDPTKLADIVSLRVRWTRMDAPQFFADMSHVFGPGQYVFGALDSAQCDTLVPNDIKPVIGLEAGPVQYNSTPGTFSPKSYATYKTAQDYGQWCGAVVAHELTAFPTVSKYSLPGNEVNSNPGLFPGGDAQIAQYSKACYAAVKAANPQAFVYGFELNMDGSLNTPAFVSRMVALGCKVGTCYDGIALHLSLQYPIPPAATPCFPHAGGEYAMSCISDIQTAAQSPVHVIIGETVYPVPGAVPNEVAKASATVAEYTAFAADRMIDGVSYANVDECASYTSGYFVGGCLISTSNVKLPAFDALKALAISHFL
jgi:hypothetical protein